ncbi:hypothetical protein SPHINGOR109_30304 [Sphingorhabdus sp. 109]|nr:hypothetical protein SPHINGOR109_30304 [Sphingorhabdus sp. 109]
MFLRDFGKRHRPPETGWRWMRSGRDQPSPGMGGDSVGGSDRYPNHAADLVAAGRKINNLRKCRSGRASPDINHHG